MTTARASGTPRLPPPTAEETTTFIRYLRRWAFFQTCATRVGWSQSRLNRILAYGRAGVPGYKEFIDAVDDAMFEQADKLLEGISKKALEEHSLSALIWLYEKRFGYREKKLADAEVASELAALEIARVTPPSIEDVEAAEARVLASLDETGRPH